MDEMLARARMDVTALAQRAIYALSDADLQSWLGAARAMSASLGALEASLAHEAAGRGIPQALGFGSARAWLRHAHRMSKSEAVTTVKLGEVCDARDRLGKAVASGAISKEQALAIGDTVTSLAATVDTAVVEAAEARLLEDATAFGPAELRVLGDRVLAHVAPEIAEEEARRKLEEAEKRAYADRTLRLIVDRVTQRTRISGTLTAEMGAIVAAALAPASKRRPRLDSNAVPSGVDPSVSASSASTLSAPAPSAPSLSADPATPGLETTAAAAPTPSPASYAGTADYAGKPTILCGTSVAVEATSRNALGAVSGVNAGVRSGTPLAASTRPASTRPAISRLVTAPPVTAPPVTAPPVTAKPDPAMTAPTQACAQRPTVGMANAAASGVATDGHFSDTDEAEHAADDRTAAQRRADALVEICRHVLGCGQPDPGPQRSQATVTVGFDTLAEQLGEGMLDTGQPVTPESARRITCDAAITPAVMGGEGQVLDLGRAQRLWTGPARRAVIIRDRGCVFPACDRPPQSCDVHHLQHWSAGGRTDLDNGALLCGFHHHLIHHANWQIRMGADRLPEVIPPSYVDPLQRPMRNYHHRLPQYHRRP